ncbi:sensor histidine kinase [Paenibacillus donghaensis]|nr:histidine kinase N-terminal 7TM domain-containing protein [Paenibacillus donghaensis]
MSYNLYLFVLLMAATCCSLSMTYLSWKRRNLPIAISYGLGMLVSSFYSFGYAFEIISTTLEHIRFWLHIEYVGIVFGPVLWFIMVLQYTGHEAWVRTRTVVLLLVVAVLTLAIQYTNEWHHLFYKSMTINHSEGFPLVTLNKGPLYSVHVIFSYLLFVIGMGLMIQMFRAAAPHMKKQIALMIVGSWGPFGFTLVYLSGVFYMPIDLSPFGFVFSGVFYLWGIYQFNLLRLAPLALQKVFESMQDAVIVFDLENSLISYNRSAARVIGGLNNKSIGCSASQVFSRHPLLMDKMLQEPSSASKVQLSDPEDDRFYNVQLTFVSNNNNRPVGKMLLLTDVTDTVRVEEKLLENARQLSELNTFKDRMFSVVAHDIRDPIAVLVNLMELLEEELQSGGEDHEEIVNEMAQQVQNTFALVEGLLDWFRSQTGGMISEPVVRDLAQIVQANLRMLLVRSGSKRIRMISEIRQDTFVYVDQAMLNLILRNLLSNAIKFTDYGGSVTLRAERMEHTMIISVSDTGEGMSAEQAESLLQDDYPVSLTGTAGERGIGLGLSLCREFVRLNGGELWFDSILAEGSTFYFSVPVLPQTTSVLSGSSMERGIRA